MSISTGISGLDAMLDGGFPLNRIVLVRGGPGSGKTTFCMQYIVEGARKNERGVYVTLEEPSELVKENMSHFSWDLKSLEKKEMLQIVDISGLVSKNFGSVQHGNQSRFVMEGIIEIIERVVPQFGASRLAIDPITSAIIQQRYPTDKRFEILELFRGLRKLNCTSLISSEFSSSSGEGDFYVEEYLADGVIVLTKSLRDFNLMKTARVEKMRGVNHDDQPRRYKITSDGLTIYHTEPVTV